MIDRGARKTFTLNIYRRDPRCHQTGKHGVAFVTAGMTHLRYRTALNK
jgi:hypothetical protein